MLEDLFKQINDIDVTEQQASIKKSLLLRQALTSTNVEDIYKAQQYLSQIDKRQPTNQKSMILDPMSLNMGNGYREKDIHISYQLLRNMYKIPIIKAIIETRKEQIISFSEPQQDKYTTGFVIRPKKPNYDSDNQIKLSKAQEKRIEFLTEFILNCGTNANEWHGDTFESFLRKWLTDSLSMDQGCFEIVRNRAEEPIEYFATDGATFRLAHVLENQEERGDLINGYAPSCVQIYQSRVINQYYPWELCFGVRNPSSDIYSNGYGRSELEDLINTVTSILNADSYNANYFKAGSNPKGILKVTGNINETRIQEFRQQWQMQMAGVQNCIHPDTLIWTKEFGGLEIENAIRGEEKDKDITIWTGLKWERAKLYKTEEKQINITRLNNGVEIKTSPEHRFAIINDEGEFDWKEQKDLQIGDYVIVNQKSLPATSELNYNSQTINEDLIEVLGWMVGDGSLFFKEWDRIERNSKGSVSLFYHHDKELDVLTRHKEVLKNYGLNVEEIMTIRTFEQIEKAKRKYTVSKKHFSLRIIQKDFVRFLIQIGFQTSAEGKVVPESIFRLSESCRCAFLRGLFSADGNKEGKCGARLTIRNDELRKQVRNLLLSVGIRTSNCEKAQAKSAPGGNKHIPKFLTIRDKKEFSEKISFLQDHKKAEGEIEDKKFLPQRVVEKYTIECIEEHKRSKVFTERERHDLSSIAYRGESCTLNRLKKFTEKTEAITPSFWDEYHFEQVVDLTSTNDKVQMYDVEVFDEIHAFVGDGVIIHNSHKMPIIEAEKMDFISTQQSNKDMEYAKYYEFLIKIACAVFKIDPAEIGFPMSGSSDAKPMFEGNNEARLEYSQDKGLKPLLKFVQSKINKYILSPLDSAYEFVFVGLDVESPEKELENDVKSVQNWCTVNEIRRKRKMSDIPGGDIILSPIMIQQMQMQQEQSNMAMEQENASDNPFEQEEDPFSKSFNEYFDKLMEEGR